MTPPPPSKKCSRAQVSVLGSSLMRETHYKNAIYMHYYHFINIVILFAKKLLLIMLISFGSILHRVENGKQDRPLSPDVDNSKTESFTWKLMTITSHRYPRLYMIARPSAS